MARIARDNPEMFVPGPVTRSWSQEDYDEGFLSSVEYMLSDRGLPIPDDIADIAAELNAAYVDGFMHYMKGSDYLYECYVEMMEEVSA